MCCTDGPDRFPMHAGDTAEMPAKRLKPPKWLEPRLRPKPGGEGVRSKLWRHSRAFLLLPAACATAAIFMIDTFIRLEFAVAVLYVVVVLTVALSRKPAWVVLAAVGCVALTVLSWLLVHRLMFPDTAVLRASMSLAAIGITTFLSLRNLSAGERLASIERQRANLARFFPPQLVDELAEANTPLAIIRNSPAAILFADMVGFTAYASDRSPEEVIALLRNLQSVFGRRIFANNGMIDKFLGDGLIAVFGLPMAGPHDVTDAVLCGLGILEDINSWNRRRVKTGEQPVRVAIGIHHGTVVQGDIGGEGRLELTVVGDTVNVASRVEACCRDLGSPLLLTAPVVAELHAEGSAALAARFAKLGPHTLRGRPAPIVLWGIQHAQIPGAPAAV
ncbi:adenylate/guanylate cyclase domain-containing protein [Amorphus sp. MBR-141]